MDLWVFIIHNTLSYNCCKLIDTNSLIYITGNANGTCYDTSYKEIITHDIPDVSIIDPGILCSNQGILNLTTLNDSLYNSLIWTGTDW